MLCSDTNTALPAVKIPIPLDLALDISYWLESIKQVGGNADLTLHVRGGNVEEFETIIKQSRKRKKTA